MEVLNRYLELGSIPEIVDFFQNEGRIKYYEKNELFIRQGQKNDLVGFIKEGGFRYLSYTSSGNEQIVGYSFEGDFVVDYPTFQTQKPSDVNVQAIKDTVIYLLKRDVINEYFKKFSKEDLRSKVAEVFLEDIYSRLLSLYCDTPEERYIKLIKRYPPILELVHLKEIASFIKVTPETLSRIRKKLA
ncbi:MAG: Crp/Fnr family transcriptional regulator [Dysgonomonas sp.]